MKKTGNYGLSQWEKTDRIMMEDFNADNAKVDAAVKAVEGKVEAVDGRLSSEVRRLETGSIAEDIRSASLPSAAPQFEVSLSGIAWGIYQFVLLHVRFPAQVEAVYYLNDTDCQSYVLSSPVSGQMGTVRSSNGWDIIALPVFGRADAIARTVSLDGALCCGQHNRTRYSGLTKLVLKAGGGGQQIPAGTEVRIQGIR